MVFQKGSVYLIIQTCPRYPTKIPLVVEKNHREKSLAPIDKMKWLVPHEMTILQLSLVLKKRLKCPPQVQFFLLIDGR